MTPSESDRAPAAATVRLVTLLAVVAVWAVITVGIAFRAAELTRSYQYLTLVVAALVSRYWGVPARLLGEGR